MLARDMSQRSPSARFQLGDGIAAFVTTPVALHNAIHESVDAHAPNFSGASVGDHKGPLLACDDAQERSLTDVPAEAEMSKAWKHYSWSVAGESTHCGLSDEEFFGDDEADHFSESARAWCDSIRRERAGSKESLAGKSSRRRTAPLQSCRKESATISTQCAFIDEELCADDDADQVSVSPRGRIGRAGSKDSNASGCLDSELGIALAHLMQSDSAEPFLCDCSAHGLLDLCMIEQRLDEGKYADVQLFWSDIDECLSLCASAGRHPSVVWEMRTLYQQLEQEFWQHIANTECLLDDMSPAWRSVTTSTLVLGNKLERCLIEFGVVGDYGPAGSIDMVSSVLGDWLGDWTVFGQPEQGIHV